jgi:glycosyltransferase involved in cell wall biosynthesis
MQEGLGSLIGRRSAHPLAGATILQILPALDVGGAQRTAIDIAAALAEAGARALVASEGGRLVSELQAKGGIWVPFPARSRNPLAMAVNARRLARLIAAERIDLVHARSRPAAWVAHGATRIAGTPFMTTFVVEAAVAGALRKRYNSVIARGDLVLAPSRYAAGALAALFPSARDRIRVVYRGVDLKHFAPANVTPARVQALRQLWAIGREDRVILLAGRLAPGKGHKTAIEAVRLLAARGPPPTLILAGEAEGRGVARDLDQAIARAGLQAQVRRFGYCADMPAALLAAAVAVVPDTRPTAMGLLAVEAQAMGTPVIVSDIGTLHELVVAPPETAPARRTGWRVPPDDPEALATALGEALGLGASALDGLARGARTHAEAIFSAERMRAEVLACYAALLGRDGEPRQ